MNFDLGPRDKEFFGVFFFHCIASETPSWEKGVPPRRRGDVLSHRQSQRELDSCCLKTQHSSFGARPALSQSHAPAGDARAQAERAAQPLSAAGAAVQGRRPLSCGPRRPFLGPASGHRSSLSGSLHSCSPWAWFSSLSLLLLLSFYIRTHFLSPGVNTMMTHP